MAMRGLTIFISDIRNCTTQEQEQKRVEQEMAHIRAKFANSGKMDAYDRKKYMWKVLYMYMLGYEIDFGHMEAVNLVTTHTYSEKSCGYVACSLLLSEHQDLLRLIIQAIKNDLAGKNEVFQCLSLVCIANVGGQEFAEALAPDVQKLLVAGSSRSYVRKKAALCLLRMFRKYPDIMSSESWAPRIINLLEDKHLGVVCSVLSLLLGLVAKDYTGYEEAVPKAIKLLQKLVVAKECDKDYTYYKTPSPWVQVKLLRLIQHFPPPKDKVQQERLAEVLKYILTHTEVTKSVNKNNADHGILFEAVNVIIHLCSANHSTDEELKSQAITLLGRFISVREPNIRYLGLETMARMARVSNTLDAIKKHQNTIQFSLKDGDISIRKRALDLLYTTCDETNAREIVDELLKYLETADYAIRDELVLKIAILAERFTPDGSDRKWYIQVILKLISLAGDHVSDDIWFRVVQIVTNHEDLHAYAANAVLEALKSPGAHETLVKVGGYVLGEFGHLLKDGGVTGAVVFEVLHRRFATASLATRALLLSSYMKLLNTFPELQSQIGPIFASHGESMDMELQQRAVEYRTFATFDNKGLVADVWEMMPAFPVRESALVKRVKKHGIAPSAAGGDSKDSDGDEETDDSDVDSDQDDDSDNDAPPKKSAAKKKPSRDSEDDDEDEKPSTRRGGSSSPTSAQATATKPPAAASKRAGQFDDLLGLDTPSPASSTSSHLPPTISQSSPMSAVSGSSAPLPSIISSSSAVMFAAPVVDDPWGTPSFDEPPAAAAPPAQDLDKVRSLYTTMQGVLYEWDTFQVGLKMQMDQGSQCKMIFYYGNKDASNTLTNLTVSFANTPKLRMQAKPETIESVGPRQQTPHYFLWHCMQPFDEAPTVQLNFTKQGQSHSVSLSIPLLATKFVLPAPREPAAYVADWKATGNEAVEVFRARDPIDIAAIRQQLSEGMHFALIDNLDKNPAANVVCAGTLHTATRNAAGEFVTMSVLARVETNAAGQGFRVTIRSGHKLVTEAMRRSVLAVFAAAQ